MSVIAPVRSSAQRTWTRIPVLTSSGEATSRACRNGTSAPSRVTSAKAKGRSRGWAATGSLTQVHEVTVPVGATSTKSVMASWVTGSNSGGGSTTRPSDVRPGDEPAVAQAGEELPQDRTGRAGVVERYGDRG